MRLAATFFGLLGCAEPLVGSGQLIEDRRVLSGFDAVETFGVNTRVAVGDAEDVVIHTDGNGQSSWDMERRTAKPNTTY